MTLNISKVNNSQTKARETNGDTKVDRVKKGKNNGRETIITSALGQAYSSSCGFSNNFHATDTAARDTEKNSVFESKIETES